MQGASLAFGESDLAAMAASYDPSKHHAPIVIGHPRTDAPAWGWVDGLSVRGDRLVAAPSRVDPSFAEMVQGGKFAKVSASFYAPGASGNPVPGSYYLRHVGFLGAQPPAVKGLAPIEFGEQDDVVTVEFADWQLAYGLGTTARLFRRLRDWIISSAGIDSADQVLPDNEIDSLGRAGVEAGQADVAATPAFAAPAPSHPATPDNGQSDMSTTTTDAAELERRAATLAAAEAAFAERQRAAAEDGRRQRATEDAAFVDQVVAAGRLPIGLKDASVALFAELGEGTLSFSEGGEMRETSPRAAFRDLLSRLPVPVVTAEIAGGKAGAVDFADPLTVAAALTTEIAAAKGKGETISPAEALNRLQKGASA
ncbi:peptidase [Ancylobacter lacus]|uniref:peptidase n=1 Tax=Ancylobacter lacus TaxID=2579970 RepID=UPI001FE3563C|nr:peptidase [Ancylobacter lacus]